MRAACRAALIAAALFFSCHSIATAEVEGWRGELPVRPAWLREQLPDDALIYVRVPDFMGLLTMPKGSSLDTVLRSEANIESVERIRAALLENVIELIPAFDDIRVRLVQEYLRSPVELAVFLKPAPSALLAMNLDIDSRQEFANVVFAAGEGGESLRVVVPLDNSGIGQLDAGGMPVFVRFDERSGRVLLHLGPAASAEAFARLLERIDAAGAHRMQALEAGIDASGQGLFAWIDAEQALPALKLTVPPDAYQRMTESGLSSVSAAALGWGVANGKGRLAVRATLLEGLDRGFIPYVSNDVRATAVGNPDAIFLMSLPDAEEFARIEEKALAVAGPVARANWVDAQQAMQARFGFNASDLLEAIGPDFIGIFDAAGDYGALRLRDRRRFDTIIDGLVANSDATLEERRIGGETYFHLVMPSEEFVEPDSDIAWLAVLATRIRDHVYWTRERDYLYFASVPQVLIDRNSMRERADIGDWLESQQRIDTGNALFAISGATRKLPMRFYYVYLELMQALADLSYADIDLWALPTARQAELPDLGTLALTLSLGDPQIALEMTFENNPTESLGGIGGIAVAGMVAAIAIPAYEDYTTRAQISEGLNLAAPVKAAVAEHYLTEGVYPDAAAADALSVYSEAGVYTDSIIVEPDTGVIIISYRYTTLPAGGQVYLEPNAGNGVLNWSCTSDIENKLLPAACRD